MFKNNLKASLIEAFLIYSLLTKQNKTMIKNFKQFHLNESESFKEYTQLKADLKYLNSSLKNCLNDNIPEKIKVEIKNLMSLVDGYDISSHKPTKLENVSGHTMTLKELKFITSDETGLNFRYNSGSDYFDDCDSDFFSKEHGIDVDQKDINIHVFDRTTDDIFEINQLVYICIPGKVIIEWSSVKNSGNSNLIDNNRVKIEVGSLFR